ncbi:MAG TPA: hypothetical protein VM680_15590 [Verrucomicrobiae bacterium]|nr:hypothetical protein [Verrucomicrobiae bacterium]
MTTPEHTWDKVVADFRQLCLLRRQKKWIESDIILNSDLPRSIATWSESAELDPTAKKSRLDSMFQAEQRRIDDAWFAADLVTARLHEEIIPSICAQITEQIRASLAEEIRSAVVAEVRAHSPQITKEPETTLPEPAVAAAPTQKHIANFAEQVRTTVAQKAYAAVIEELGREPRPAKAPPKPTPAPARPRSPRVPFNDVPAVIDFVLAEEQQSLKNKYKFELTACP